MTKVLAEALGNHHFLMDHVATLAEAYEAIAQYSYDLVILDRQLPGGDGMELIKSMRAAANAVAESTFRNPKGKLEVKASPQLKAYLKQIPGFWYVIRNNTGQQCRYGTIPGSIASAIPAMDAVAYADLGQNINKDSTPLVTIQWAQSPTGVIKIITTPDIPITFITIPKAFRCQKYCGSYFPFHRYCCCYADCYAMGGETCTNRN